MAKFCTNCGKKLEEGKACECKAVAAEKVETTKEVTKNLSQINVKDTTGTVVEVAKGIFTKPISTIKKLANAKNFNLGLIILAVAIVAQALFMTMSLQNTFDIDEDDLESAVGTVMVVGIISEISDGIGDLLEEVVEYDDGEIEFDFVRVLVYSVVISAVIYGALLLSLFIVLKVFMKKDVDLKKLLTTMSITSCINIVLWLAAIVLMFLVPEAITLVIIALGLYFIFTLYTGLTMTEDLDENKFPLMYSVAYSATVVILYVLLQII